jgi:pyruvate dehydrogenase E2 component (dihydrolipoamide acetyltransferase)
MSVSVTMPQLGESVTEGTVTRWLKQIGDTVAMDEPLLEVSTDKVDTEIPSPVAGTLLSIDAGEDDVVLIGGLLAVIGEASDAAAPPAAPAEPDPVVAEPVAAAAPPTAEPVADAPAASAGTGTPILLPALGESVTEGTVTRWLKAIGDAVAVDEPLLEVSTDKVDTEIPSPVAGTLLEINVDEDQTVNVGTQLGLVGAAGAVAAPVAATVTPSAPAPTPAPISSPPLVLAVAAAESANAVENAPSDGDSAYVTPLVRKLAADLGIELGTVAGTGVGGRIRKQDVQAAADARTAAAAAPAPPVAAAPNAAAGSTAASLRGRTEKMSRLRKVIAERMVESLQVSAQLTTVVEVDVTRIAALRQKVKGSFAATEGVNLSYLPFFAKATVEALKAFPQVNASIDSEAGTVTYHDETHLGVAVDTERGLLVPVINGAGDLSVAGIARKIADLAERTRSNKVTPDELSGGTFTLTNTGSRGALFDTPIINQPQVAILGTGAVVKRPVVITDDTGADSIAIRAMVYLALTYDHRLVDGADASRFLVAIKTRLEEGAFEAELGLR